MPLKFNPLSGNFDLVNAASTGDVVGPASSTDNAIVRYDGTTGKLVQNSGVSISDANAVSGITQLDVDNIRVDGNTISSTDTNGNIELDPNGAGLVAWYGTLRGMDTTSTIENASTSGILQLTASGSGGTVTVRTGGVDRITVNGAGADANIEMTSSSATLRLNASAATGSVALRANGADRLTVSSAGLVTVPGNGTFGGLTLSGGSAANLSIWSATNVLRLRGGTSGLAIDNTSGSAIGSVTDAGAWTLANSSAFTGQHTSYGRHIVLSNAVTADNILDAETSSSAFGARLIQANASNGSVNLSNFYLFAGRAAGSDRFFVVGTGQIHSTSTSITAISDASQKENVKPLSKGLAEVLALRPVSFDFKPGKGSGEKNVMGFIAQDVELVLPNLVTAWQSDRARGNKKNDETVENLKALKMGDMIPVLVKAIQEQQAQIEQLKSEIAALKAK